MADVIDYQILGDGHIGRSYQRKRLGKSISSVAVNQIVHNYGVMIGISHLATDDLSRTYAQLAYNSGVAPLHTKDLMGHAGLSTTQMHLNRTIDLDDISGDFVSLKG